MVKAIRDKAPAYLNFLKNIVAIETPSEDKVQLDKMADFVEAFVKSRGFECERIPFERSGDFLRVWTGQGSEKPVMFMAHMDTVHPIGIFGEKTLWEEGNMLHGPGAADCKGGIASSLLIMEALRENKDFKRPTVMLLTSDEEISGRLSGERGFDAMKDTAKECCAVFNAEPGTPDGITVARKGILRLKVAVTGKAAHAGNSYFTGASAIREAANLIIKIEAESSKEGCTYNCGLISGGSSANTVPAYCEFTVDIRGVTVRQLDEGYDTVLKHVGKNTVEGTSARVEVLSRRPPMEDVPGNYALLEKINEAAREMGMSELKPIRKGGGSDAAYTVIAGTPSVCSCAMVGRNEHSLRETVDMSSLEPRAELIYRAALKL